MFWMRWVAAAHAAHGGTAHRSQAAVNNSCSSDIKRARTPQVSGDSRTLEKLFDGLSNTWRDSHMWLYPILRGHADQPNKLTLRFPKVREQNPLPALCPPSARHGQSCTGPRASRRTCFVFSVSLFRARFAGFGCCSFSPSFLGAE